MKINDKLKYYQERIEHALSACLPNDTVEPNILHNAMRYVVLGGGKRIRAALVYATGEALDIRLDKLDPIACALECIHAYSLVHDDLPAMDDDDLRRGRPSCHKAYDEATAILVGDALQALAFECLCSDDALGISAEQKIKLVSNLCQAIGSRGMVGGQSLDLAASGQSISKEALETIHHLKTGALLQSSVTLPAIAASLEKTTHFLALEHYAKAIGLAFQIRDDILDVTATTEQLGKQQGSDDRNQKTTFVSVYGLDGAREQLQQCHHEAIEALAIFDNKAQTLTEIADYICQRQH